MIGVLIVDDEPDIRLLARILIEERGEHMFVCGEARCGRDALALLGPLEPAVVVLDARMPGLDGVETARQIRIRRPGVRIVLCTGLLDEHLRDRALAAGVDACLTKDQFREIPETVRALADGCYAPTTSVSLPSSAWWASRPQ